MNFYLITLPCGCVAEWVTLASVDGYVECPWCRGVFCGVDLHDWYEGEPPPPILIEQARPLIGFADQILEVVSRCGGCGEFIVREHGKRDEAHLGVPTERLQFLRN
jgi:hypothetical protein